MSTKLLSDAEIDALQCRPGMAPIPFARAIESAVLAKVAPASVSDAENQPIGQILSEAEMFNAKADGKAGNVIWWNKPKSGLIYAAPTQSTPDAWLLEMLNLAESYAQTYSAKATPESPKAWRALNAHARKCAWPQSTQQPDAGEQHENQVGAHDWRESVKLGAHVCASCGAVRGSQRGNRACYIPFKQPAPQVAQQAGYVQPLSNPRLQELFTSAITGAMGFGFQGIKQPPPGHWLTQFWDIGRNEALALEAETSRPPQVTQGDERALRNAVENVLKNFEQSEALGYRAKDRQFAIDILREALSRKPSAGHCINCGLPVDPRCNCERGRAALATKETK